MRRREFIKVIAGSAAAWPLAARAQQPLMPVVGFLNAASAEGYTRQLTAFLKGLGEAGYVDGRNVTIEYRWADGRSDRLPAMVADLVQRQVAVIAATSTPAALAAKASTTTVPIVFETGADPVRLGLVANLNRPGGNITGVTQLSQEVAPKRLQMLHELLPMATSIALLINPSEPTAAETQSRDVLSAARNLGLELHVLNASSESDLDGVFAEVTKMRVGGLVIGGSPFFTSRTKQLGALALRHAVPTVYSYREFAMAGGLLSYGADIADAYHLVGNYTGRILKGDKPGDLPIQQATTKVEMYINLKTAKALGVSIPNTLIGRADEVIE
ncbi:MAG: ABC transporter substrate-binding protein [Pseudolabrys sp.]|jgi:putative ABC transport system substrate-binding protein